MHNKNIHHLVWLDLEMTGLNPLKDRILEIAVVITTNDLVFVAQSPSYTIFHTEEELKKMDDWCKKKHTETKLIDAVLQSSLSMEQVEQLIITFISQYCYQDTSLLCGNSIWADKFFLKMQMPTLYSYLHYRIIDVSSIKELIKRWYPNDPQSSFKKENKHRSLDDIHESIKELKHYKKHFFKTSFMP